MKGHFLFLICLIFSAPLSGSAQYQLEWFNQSSSPNAITSFGENVVLHPNGDIVVTGYESFGVGQPHSVTICYDASGNEKWKSIFKWIDGHGWRAFRVPWGNTFIAGTFETNEGVDDSFLLEYDTIGDSVRRTNLHSPGQFKQDIVRDAAMDSNGNMYISADRKPGNTNTHSITRIDSGGVIRWEEFSPASFAMTAIELYHDTLIYAWGHLNSQNSVLYRYDTSGNMLWSRNFTYFRNTAFAHQTLGVDNMGNAIIGGTSTSQGLGTIAAILSVSPAGDTLWTSALTWQGQVSNQSVINMACDRDAIYSIRTSTLNETYLTKTDLNGQQVWVDTIPQGLTPSASHNFERLKVQDGIVRLVTGNNAIHYLEYDTAGNRLIHFVQSIPSSFNQVTPQDVETDTAGNVWITGALKLSGYTLFVMKLSPAVTRLSSSVEVGKSKLHIYPNPAEDMLHVDGLGENFNFQVFTADGKLLFTGNSNGTVDVSHLKTGMYILSTADGHRVGEGKFVKK